MSERLGGVLNSADYEPKVGEVYWLVTLPGGETVQRPFNTRKYLGWSVTNSGAKYLHKRKQYDAVLMAAGSGEWESQKSRGDDDESGSVQATLPQSSGSTRGETRSRSTSKKRGSS